MGTKPLVEGAMAASLATMLAAVGYFIPILQIVTAFTWFIPIIVVIVRHDLRTGVMALSVTALLLGMFLNPLRALLLLLSMGPASLVYGYGFKHNWTPGKTLISGGVVIAASALIGLLLSAQVIGMELGEMRQQMMEQVDSSVELYRQLGLLDNGALSEQEMRETAEYAAEAMLLLFPSMLIIGALFTGGVGFILSRLTLRRLNYEIGELPPFREWQLPWYLVWGVVLALVMLLAGDYLHNETLKKVAYNLFYIYAPILLLSGISVLAYFNYYWKVAKFLKIILLVVMVLNLPFTVTVLIILGLFDPLFSYRNWIKSRQEKKKK